MTTPAPPQHPGHLPEAAQLARTHEQRGIEAVDIQLRAFNSLTPKGVRIFLTTVAIGPLITTAYCVARGFWPVLPFAGLELVLLWLALRWSFRRGAQQETISITQDFVTITAQLGVSQAKTRFPRHWTKVKLRAPRSGPHPSRLCFESGGRTCEVGKFLTEDERRVLALRLQQLIGNMNDSPAL